MDAFKKNIKSVYRKKGEVWLADLLSHVQQIAVRWNLTELKPFNNLSYNYVLSGFQNETPVVLKLSPDFTSLLQEAMALKAFAGYGAVSILDIEEGALLLEKAVPGEMLKTYFSSNDQSAIQVACEVMKKLHRAPLPKDGQFPHIDSWLAALDKEWNIPRSDLELARRYKAELKHISTSQVLLHGDLHQDNILSNQEDWLVIDPKGVIGSPINEVWAFVERVESPEKDLKYISDYFQFKFEEVVKWYYVHLILAACWNVEDGLDPQQFLNLAHSIRNRINE